MSRKKHLRPSSYDNEDDFVLGLPGRRLSVDERGFFNSVILSSLLEWCQVNSAPSQSYYSNNIVIILIKIGNSIHFFQLFIFSSSIANNHLRRLQKLHNVGITLTKLQEEGIKLDNVPGGPIVTKSVVDGNQSLTLALIWRIIFQHSITRIMAVDQLRAETR